MCWCNDRWVLLHILVPHQCSVKSLRGTMTPVTSLFPPLEAVSAGRRPLRTDSWWGRPSLESLQGSTSCTRTARFQNTYLDTRGASARIHADAWTQAVTQSQLSTAVAQSDVSMASQAEEVVFQHHMGTTLCCLRPCLSPLPVSLRPCHFLSLWICPCLASCLSVYASLLCLRQPVSLPGSFSLPAVSFCLSQVGFPARCYFSFFAHLYRKRMMGTAKFKKPSASQKSLCAHLRCFFDLCENE